MSKLNFDLQQILNTFKLEKSNPGTSVGGDWFGENRELISSLSPVDGKEIARVGVTSEAEYNQVVDQAQKAFLEWRLWPAPKRGEVVRQFGEALRKNKELLGQLVSYEMGKSYQEGLGEVQEMIDICDFSVGLSRQLHGLTMHSERSRHRMYEQYHPMGVVGIISAFNFPVAVWSWNAAIAWVCGDTTVWKASEKAPLTALVCQNIVAEVFRTNKVPEGVSCVVTGDYRLGEWMSHDTRLPIISATGSTRMGKKVAAAVGARLGKSLLELGGNNAIIISKDADLKLALIGAIFGAVGTAGQRCTTTRRLIIHEDIYETVKERLKASYAQLRIGNPLDPQNHVGPLIDKDAVKAYQATLQQVEKEGGKALVEGGLLEGEGFESGCYVKPAVYEVENSFEIVKEETFAPILYLFKYSSIEEAISMQNDVPQGLSSAIMTNNLRESELFLSHAGSDCGIANVNIGTSGAEIGGAFGGEKETGGGRESGSDAWKFYMRRQTTTINYGVDLPLAQGIQFNI